MSASSTCSGTDFSLCEFPIPSRIEISAVENPAQAFMCDDLRVKMPINICDWWC
jgi:hypothetical protein